MKCSVVGKDVNQFILDNWSKELVMDCDTLEINNGDNSNCSLLDISVLGIPVFFDNGKLSVCKKSLGKQKGVEYVMNNMSITFLGDRVTVNKSLLITTTAGDICPELQNIFSDNKHYMFCFRMYTDTGIDSVCYVFDRGTGEFEFSVCSSINRVYSGNEKLTTEFCNLGSRALLLISNNGSECSVLDTYDMSVDTLSYKDYMKVRRGAGIFVTELQKIKAVSFDKGRLKYKRCSAKNCNVELRTKGGRFTIKQYKPRCVHLNGVYDFCIDYDLETQVIVVLIYEDLYKVLLRTARYKNRPIELYLDMDTLELKYLVDKEGAMSSYSENLTPIINKSRLLF